MLAIALSLEGWSRKPRLRGKAEPAPPSSEVAEEERANVVMQYERSPP